ncbi:MAG: hypothetical protein KDK10_05565 [Maritimibacter sp.]|nr:hypothetical protein [Maritimibacter sp.]
MKTKGLALIAGAALALSFPNIATAGSAISGACMQTRGAEAPTLCGCIQTVADAVLTPEEQARGAKIFLEPHISQEIRASASGNDTAFWQKWEVFGATAAEYCQ